MTSARAPIRAATPSAIGTEARSDWRSLLFFLFPLNLMLSLDKHAVALASPLIGKEMGLSLVQISIIVSAASWSYAILQLPSGWFVERFGFRRTMQFATFFWAAVTIVNASATGFVMLLLIRIALGIGQAPDWSASVVAVKQWFDPGRRSAATSTLLSSLYLGLLIGGPAATWLIAHGSWRSCLVTYGVLGLVFATLWSLFAPRDRDGGSAERRSVASFAAMRAILRNPQVWLLGFSYYFLTGILSFYSTMLPSYLVSSRGLELLSIGALLSVPYCGLYLAVLLSGKLSDLLLVRLATKRAVRMPMAVGGMLVAAAGLAGMLAAQSNVGMGLSIALSLAGCGFAQVTTWAAIQDMGGPQTGLISGWVGFWGNLSVGTTPILVALLQRHTASWSMAILLPIAMGVACAGVWLLVKPDTVIMED